jgi:hypothetical protein
MRMIGVVVVVFMFACGGPGDSGETGGGAGAVGGGNGSGGGTGSGGGAATCSSANCPGCCFNGACQAGTAGSACGKGGAVCASCSGRTICKSSQVCGVDDAKSFIVAPFSATITANNNGSSWDGDGSAPDVIVKMSCNAQLAGFSATSSEKESYTPQWTDGTGSCSATASQLKANGFAWQIEDSDLTSNDTITGRLYHLPTDAEIAQTDTLCFGASGGATAFCVLIVPSP